MRVAIVLVHYRTPELAAEAVAALRRDLAGSGMEAEWILVDNGSDGTGRALLESLPVRRIDPRRNLGYAGAVNLGARETAAEILVFLNCDVLVQPGCLGALAAAVREGQGAAGPRFYWDRGRTLLLPPTEVRSRRRELLAALAHRGPAWAARARRSWRRHARRHWRAADPLPSAELNGALLAVHRRAWEEVGEFDEGYLLYFEETDWLRRLRRRGLPSLYLPGAEAVHLYNQSAGAEGRAAAWFAASSRRFQRRHYGPWFPPLAAALARGGGPPGFPPSLGAGRPALELAPLRDGGEELWVEVSPNPLGFPAAAEPVAGREGWRLPGDVWEGMAPGAYLLQVTDHRGRELGRWRFEKGRGGS